MIMSCVHSTLHKVSIQSIDHGLSHIPAFRCFRNLLCRLPLTLSSLLACGSQMQPTTWSNGSSMRCLTVEMRWHKGKDLDLGPTSCTELSLIYVRIKCFAVKGPLLFLGREAVNQYSAIVNAHTHTQTGRGTSRTVLLLIWMKIMARM